MFDALRTRLVRWLRRRETERRLRRLDARTLADIGIPPEAIADRARRAILDERHESARGRSRSDARRAATTAACPEGI